MLSYTCCPYWVDYSDGLGDYGGYEQPIPNRFFDVVYGGLGFLKVFLTTTVTHLL